MSFHVITVGQCTHPHVHVTFLGISKQSHIQEIISVMRRLTIWARQRLLVNTCWTQIKNKKSSILGCWLFQDPICYCVGRGALPNWPTTEENPSGRSFNIKFSFLSYVQYSILDIWKWSLGLVSFHAFYLESLRFDLMYMFLTFSVRLNELV